MKVILVGHPGSQHIVPASAYLTNKYLPGFDIEYLNHEGPIVEWSAFVANHLKTLTDDLIIFGLDDYLLSAPLNVATYNIMLDDLAIDAVVCAKLCLSTQEEHNEYPVTTQYAVWKRKHLIDILWHVNTPWEFELDGSIIFRNLGLQSVYIDPPPLEYYCNSSLSARWQGVNLAGVKQEDIRYIKENQLL